MGYPTQRTLLCYAKSLQSCPTLYDPIVGSPPGSPVPGILQARTLEWVAISFFNAWKWKVKVKSLSRVRRSVTPWTAAFQALPSMGFSRQEYWSGVPLPTLQQTLVWANSGWWWRTGKPGMLQSMGLQSQTQLSNWTELFTYKNLRLAFFFLSSHTRFICHFDSLFCIEYLPLKKRGPTFNC